MTEKPHWKHTHRRLKAEEEAKRFENWEEKDFIKEILDLRDQLEELSDEIETLKKEKEGNIPVMEPEQIQDELSETDYKSSWSYPTKVVFLLTLKGTPLTTEEIHNDLLKLDKHYGIYPNPKATLSVYLTKASKTGRIKAIKLPGIKKHSFALPEWFDERGELKTTYQTNQATIFK